MLAPSASSTYLASRANRPSPPVRNAAARRNKIEKSNGFFSHSLRSSSRLRATKGMGHTAPQRNEASPAPESSPPPESPTRAPGNNVWHEPPPVAVAEESQFRRTDRIQHEPTSYPLGNPDTPAYLYEIESVRTRYVELEANAVQERDYVTAATSAKHIARLVQIETELLMADTSEMESSLAQEYAAALTHKRRKEYLLAEFEEIQLDLHTPNRINAAGRGAATVDGETSPTRARRDAIAFNTVPVRFGVNAQTRFGETVAVCGSLPELGSWETTDAPQMTYVEGKKTWGITLQLPKGSNFRFKFVIGVQKEGQGTEEGDEKDRDEDEYVPGAVAAAAREKTVARDWYWQDGADRAVQMPLEDVISMDVVVDWDGDREKEKMWLCMPVPFAPSPSPEGKKRE